MENTSLAHKGMQADESIKPQLEWISLVHSGWQGLVIRRATGTSAGGLRKRSQARAFADSPQSTATDSGGGRAAPRVALFQKGLIVGLLEIQPKQSTCVEVTPKEIRDLSSYGSMRQNNLPNHVLR